MKRLAFILTMVSIFMMGLLMTNDTMAQCGELANKCAPLLKPYKSDGQFHRALLLEGETAEFETTFYKGNKYRIISCTGPHEDIMVFSVFDSKYNLVFSNSDYEYTQYWDFKFNATDKYIVQAELIEGAGSGCAVVLIGFKD